MLGGWKKHIFTLTCFSVCQLRTKTRRRESSSPTVTAPTSPPRPSDGSSRGTWCWRNKTQLSARRVCISNTDFRGVNVHWLRCYENYFSIFLFDYSLKILSHLLRPNITRHFYLKWTRHVTLQVTSVWRVEAKESLSIWVVTSGKPPHECF